VITEKNVQMQEDFLNLNGQKRIRKSSVKTLELAPLAFNPDDYAMLEKFWHDYHYECVSLEEAVKKIVMADLKLRIGVIKIINIYKKRRASESVDDILAYCKSKGLPVELATSDIREIHEKWLEERQALAATLKMDHSQSSSPDKKTQRNDEAA